MDKALYSLHKAYVGPGGLYCSCCNPAFGRFRGPHSRKNRQASKRALRRSERQKNRIAGADELHRQFADWVEEYTDLMNDFGIE